MLDDPLAAATLSAPNRYAYFVSCVAESEELWTLRNADDFVFYAANDGQELLPVWPDRQLAAACAANSWDDCQPFKIDLARWLAAWTPGLETEGRAVAVFPVPSDQGIVVTPDQLATDLGEEG